MSSIDEKIVNSIKGLSIDMIHLANSGHPGISLGATNIIYTLYSKHLKISLDDYMWINRDRFVMSAGHGSALLYSVLFYSGYLSLDNLKRYRQINSLTPGHPENIVTPSVDTTTGPLGQGIATSVGMAISEKYLSKKYGDNAFDYYTYVLCSDGDLMEGVSYEALSLAGTLKLGKLIVLYDSNNISLDGNINLTFNEDIKSRFESIGWNYLKVLDGNSIEEIDNAIIKAKSIKNKPTLIEIKTIIGKDSLKQNTNLVHGTPLTEEDINQLKFKLELSDKIFDVDNSLLTSFQSNIRNRCDKDYESWINNNEDIEEELSASFDLLKCIRDYSAFENESLRDINSKVMNIISDNVDSFIGGSADLSSSTKCFLNNKGTFSPINYSGRNIYYGVREHAMGAISNGMALCGLMPFASTFLVFSDYIKPAIRLSAIMDLPVTYVFTHDSITIGSDGPTHQPIEQLTMLRSIPNFRVFRPADVKEIIGSWNEILNNPKPSAIVVSRNASPMLDSSNPNMISNGAYIIKREKSKLSAIIIATGTEVNTAIEVANLLEKEKIYLRVVSMPCMSLYESTDETYKEKVLPAGYKKFVIEYGSSYSWYKYVYNEKYLININKFGKSGSKDDLLKDFNLDNDSIKNYIKKILK
jgi:transketolase